MFQPPAMSTAEKIETIVQCRASGTLGEFVEYVPGKFRVTADGHTVLVKSGPHGWHVSFKGYEAIDEDLMVAASFALAAGSRINATKHTNLSRDLADWS